MSGPAGPAPGRRVLVTGAQGFLGRYCVAEALDGEPDVTVLGVGRSEELPGTFSSNLSWGNVTLAGPLPPAVAAGVRDERYRYVPLDLRNRPALVGLLQAFRPDLVIHLAASLRDQPPAELIEINVGVVVDLVEALASAGGDRPTIVFGSSGAVYGNAPGRALPLGEDDRCTPLDPYSVSKRAAEDMARVLCRRIGIDARWARIFNPVGPGLDERHLPASLARRVAEIANGMAPRSIQVGATHTTRDFLDARDVAAAVLAVARSGAPGATYNVASGTETSGQDLLDLALGAAGLTGVAIDRRPPRPDDVERVVADVSRLAALGFRPRHSLTGAMEHLVGYYRHDVAQAAAHTAPGRAREDRPLRVRASQAHAYDVEVCPGLLARMPTVLRRRFGDASLVVLTDDVVGPLYGDDLVNGLRALGGRTGQVVVEAGERSKGLTAYADLVGRLYDAGLDRRGVLVNLGGGLITDLGGFLAATYLRGVAYVNVPTTLLAQHDSAIGGKVGVNAGWAKNFLGSFHHPVGVYSDPLVLRTLDDRNVSAGVVEAIKVAMCADAGLLDLLEQRVDDVLVDRDVDVLQQIVLQASQAKIRLLAPDPYEVDLRRALNLGHTYGHSLEVEAGFELLHGEAVAMGLLVATAIAEARKLCRPEYAARIYRVVDRYRVPPPIAPATLAGACKGLDAIRVARAGLLNYVLPIAAGSVTIVPEVDDAEIHAAVERLADHPRFAGRFRATPVTAG